MLRSRIIPVTPFAQNCSLLWCDATGRAAVVDPGGDLEHILAAVREEGLVVEKSSSPTATSTMPAAPRRWRVS